MKKVFIGIFLFWTVVGVVAQNRQWSGGKPSFTVMGKLLEDGSDNPVEFATVSLFNQSDSSLVTGGLTDGTGFFSIDTKPGNYYLRIQFMGYQDLVISDVKLNRENQTFNAGRLAFKQDLKLLDEVVVQAERTQMEMTLEKKVFNIGKDLSNLGGSATDILDNLPSVQVDVDGNVSLRGSDNVRILIDGKPSGLVGLSSNDALRQLNSNLVESVEVITNPSARYDAEGLAGIINIVLKKDKKKGVNGSFQANVGSPANHGGSVNLNLRRDWINFFTNVGVNYRRFPGGGDSFQVFDSTANDIDDPFLITNRTRTHDRGGISYSTRFGADLFLNELNTLTLAFLYRYSDEDNDTELLYFDQFPAVGTDSLTVRRDNEGEGDENLEYSINYTRKFKRKDQKFTADFQYQNNNEQERSDLVESIGTDFTNQVPFLFQRAVNDEIEERIMVQADYIHPYGKKGKIEVGTRYTDRLVGNDYLVTEQDENGIYQPDPDFSNEFEYEEKVTAVYGIISNEFRNLSWQAGLRYEGTDLITEQKTTNERNVQRYDNLFPSTFITYKLTKLQSLQASYSRRISRPRGRFLNPFTSISDSRNFWVGNPNLQPEFTDSFEVGYLLNGEKGTVYTGVYYRYTEGVIQRLRATDQNGITFTRPYNIAEENAYGVELNFSKDFVSWYRVNGNVNFFRSYIPSGFVMFGETEVPFEEARATSLSTRLSNNFKFKKLFDAQVNVTYRAPRNTVQGRTLSITAVDLGFTRDVLRGNGTLALNVRDLFNTRKWRSETTNENSFQTNEFQWRRRTATLSFTYRLNQKKSRGGSRGQRGDYEGGEF